MAVTYQKPNAPCRGCGFTIRNDMAQTNAAVREYYCVVCDPNGARENRALVGEGRPTRYDLSDA